jgi:outer membrane protein insertion porin family
VFLTLQEDFLGRKSILKLNSRLGYIFGGGRVPTYERFYLGGRSFRGFEFREVSPKGIRADTGELGDDPVGGEWLIFLGAQYEFPLFQETITGVTFLDPGTVTEDVGFDDYRVSIGAGLRLYIPQLGPVPIAFDFGFPIVYEEEDDKRLFSFSAELPF